MASDNQQSVLELFKNYEHFCKCMLDAYVLLDDQGKVVKCNPLFSQIVGKTSRQVMKADNLDDLIRLEVNGHSLTAKSLLENSGPTRIDEVAGFTDVQENMNLILGVYPFVQEEGPLGIFVLIRDVTAETNLQGKYKDKAAQSITDKLTGLYNRSYFDTALPELIKTFEEKKRRNEQRLSLIMGDVDHFKKVNDTYGHQAGDYVLEVSSKVMKDNFRKTDIVCRYGGEEFVIILPSTDLTEACVAAEKIRAAVENTEFIHNGTKIPVTISLGVAQVAIGRETGEQTLARADAALYHSKENGRNRISKHTEDDIE